MFHYGPAGRGIAPAREPEWLIELSNSREWNLDTREISRETNQAVNIPCRKPPAARAEVVLLSHDALRSRLTRHIRSIAW